LFRFWVVQHHRFDVGYVLKNVFGSAPIPVGHAAQTIAAAASAGAGGGVHFHQIHVFGVFGTKFVHGAAGNVQFTIGGKDSRITTGVIHVGALVPF